MACDAAIRSYCREAERKLELPSGRRKTLLAGLQQELKERFSSEGDLTLRDICEEVGSPEDTAATLMESVSLEERERYRMQKRWKIRGLIAALAVIAVLALGLIAHMWSNGGLVVIETTHYVDGFPEDLPMGEVHYDYDD